MIGVDKLVFFIIGCLILFFIILIVLRKNNLIKPFKKQENYDGYGKSFGQFYYPIPDCLKTNNCFAGSYIKNMPYYSDMNKKKRYNLDCCLDKHLGRHCKWAN